MNYDHIMESAISYIEENLHDSISLEGIANHLYLSVPQLYRIFTAYNCTSVKKYIRRRRVSEAARLIRKRENTILDIALSVGFESHEVFIRAFKQVYGVSPTKIKHNNKLELIEPFDVTLHKLKIESEVRAMNVPIVLFKELNLQVKSIKINQQDQVEQNIIGKFVKQVRESLGNLDHRLYSLYEYDVESLKEDDENINYTYFVGIESKELIEDFTVLDVPSNRYAEFIYDREKMTLNNIELSSFTYQNEPITDVYDYIDGIWTITSGYILSGDMDFEIRDKDEPNIIRYYISIK